LYKDAVAKYIEAVAFLNEAVSVTVLILDGVEDELPLKVFV
jgi:hypothetical protein